MKLVKKLIKKAYHKKTIAVLCPDDVFRTLSDLVDYLNNGLTYPALSYRIGAGGASTYEELTKPPKMRKDSELAPGELWEGVSPELRAACESGDNFKLLAAK